MKAGKSREIRKYSADDKYNVQKVLLQCQRGTLPNHLKIVASKFTHLWFDQDVSVNKYINRYSGVSSITAMTPSKGSLRVSDLRMADNQQPRERGWLVFKHHVLTHKIGETWLYYKIYITIIRSNRPRPLGHPAGHNGLHSWLYPSHFWQPLQLLLQGENVEQYIDYIKSEN